MTFRPALQLHRKAKSRLEPSSRRLIGKVRASSHIYRGSYYKVGVNEGLSGKVRASSHIYRGSYY